MSHPRDRYLTVYGRKPVLELLEDVEAPVARVWIASRARGPAAAQIRRLAASRGVALEEVDAARVSRISRRPKQDQGVAADVEAPAMRALEAWLPSAPAHAAVLALDGVTTPGNVGLILRAATVLGLDGVLVPRRGVPAIGPQVIKASAGVALRAPILRCARLDDALSEAKLAGFCVYGLADDAPEALAGAPLRAPAVFVLGNETEGLSPTVAPLLDARLRIPMTRPGDSLNVATAAAIVAYELSRRRGEAAADQSSPSRSIGS